MRSPRVLTYQQKCSFLYSEDDSDDAFAIVSLVLRIRVVKMETPIAAHYNILKL